MAANSKLNQSSVITYPLTMKNIKYSVVNAENCSLPREPSNGIVRSTWVSPFNACIVIIITLQGNIFVCMSRVSMEQATHHCAESIPASGLARDNITSKSAQIAWTLLLKKECKNSFKCWTYIASNKGYETVQITSCNISSLRFLH